MWIALIVSVVVSYVMVRKKNPQRPNGKKKNPQRPNGNISKTDWKESLLCTVSTRPRLMEEPQSFTFIS